jgi:hypothetical protein
MQALSHGRIEPYTGAHQAEHFVNPLDARVQAYELSLVREIVGRYPVDGVMLDWIRFDNFNMDLGPATRRAYRRRTGVDPAHIDFSQDSPARRRWNEFRTEAVARQVDAVRASMPRGKDLGVYIVPPEFVEVGQDAARFQAATDLLSPMCYHLDWGFDLEWQWHNCLPSTVAKAGRAEIVPAMDSMLADADYEAIFQHLHSSFPMIRRLAWFHHGRWDEARMSRIEALSHR